MFRSDPPRADDGRTVLAPGVIRPYKGLADAVAPTLAVPEARLLVAGDPRIPLDELRADRRRPGRVAARLSRPRRSSSSALSEATVAVFPYRAELDQSGALLQALGAGVPAVVYDVGGLGEVVGRFGAGRVVAAGRRRRPERRAPRAARRRRTRSRPHAKERRRARDELTWDAAAAAHLALYEELV